MPSLSLILLWLHFINLINLIKTLIFLQDFHLTLLAMTILNFNLGLGRLEENCFISSFIDTLRTLRLGLFFITEVLFCVIDVVLEAYYFCNFLRLFCSLWWWATFIIFQFDFRAISQRNKWVIVVIFKRFTFSHDNFFEIEFFPHSLFSAVNLYSHFKIYFLIFKAISISIKRYSSEKIQCFIKHNFFIRVSILHRISLIHLHCFLLTIRLLWTQPEDGDLQFEALFEVYIDGERLEDKGYGSIYHFLGV